MIDAPAKAKYREALDELLFVSPLVGNIARSMGFPVWDETQDTAYIAYEPEQKTIVFAMNPTFVESLTDEEAAGVLAHETYHMILDHLEEMLDKTNYPDAQALVKAQECIINDTISVIHQLALPSDVMRGPDLIGEDLSSHTTFSAYKLFVQDQQDQSGAPKSDSEGSSDSADGGAGSGSSDSNGDQQASDSGTNGDQQGSPGACGGIQVPDGMEAEAADAIKGVFKAAADSMGITEDELAQQMHNTTPGGYSPTGASFSEDSSYTPERMNWRTLLARINPKVMESGKTRRRTTNNWTTYNRRMGSVYPSVILPRIDPVIPKATDQGDALPTLVVALDLSGSIPRTLVKTLQGMLNDIPEDLIKAYPCTWATHLIPYDEEHHFRVASGGTRIENVSAYVSEIEKKTGTKPYVLVITDGQFHSSFKRPGREWLFMAVDRRSVKTIRTYYGGHVKPDEEVYLVDDFKI